jgi:serine/threonine-protein kinase HipA
VSFTPTRLLSVGLRLDGEERPVGRLAWVDRRILFEFDAAFLASPLPLSPLRLPVKPGVLEDPKRTFEGLFGLFDDSLPDGWGRLLLDREMDHRGVGRGALTPLDRLAFVGQEGAGALTYRPAWEAAAPSVVDLAVVADEARRVLEGDEASVFPELIALGGSSGGARPKAYVGWRPEDGTLVAGRSVLPAGHLPVLVKFPLRGDPADVGAIELAYARMAVAAGIDVSPTWLLGTTREQPGYFATRRFDRAPRAHIHTACGLLHADHRVPSLDYEALLKATRWLTRDQRAVDQMFRRMAFNVVAHNRDDHSRNFAFRMDETGRWHLAPAFDLTFSSGPGGEHWMTVAGEGRRPGTTHLFEVARRVGVVPEEAARIVDDVRASVADWASIAEEAGVGTSSRRRVGSALAGVSPGLDRP